MKKVRLLLSGKTNLQYYSEAFTAAGAEPTVKYLPEINLEYDGLVLCGGSDIDPKYYNQEINGSVDIDNDRDGLEFALLKAYIEAGKPIMGICRGYQLINVYFGGSLFQHIPEVAQHRSGVDLYAAHTVTAVENSDLSKLYGDTFAVNSAHHQAVDRLGDGLRPTAYWNDKYIEAYEHKALPIFAVQWHPERMCAGQRRPDTVDGLPIIKHFVDMCKQNNGSEK